jgi:Mg2+ and Co2+ transporter CorA
VNDKKRKELAEAVRLLNMAEDIIDRVRDAEQDSRDNLPENMADGDRAISMEDAIDKLSDAIDEIDDAINRASELVEEAMQ